MASFVKFAQFRQDLGNGVHTLSAAGCTLKIALTNSAPTASSDATISDITQIAYTNLAGTWPADTTNTATDTGSVYRIAGTDITQSATGGNVATFRYAVVYNDTPTSPADPLIGYWDKGTAISLTTGDSFTWDTSTAIIEIS